MIRRIGVLIAVAFLATGCGYNRIQELDERADQMESNIDTELQRRNDLIPNLVSTVDEAARFEQETQTRVAEARAGLNTAQQRMGQALQGEGNTEEVSAANEEVRRNLNMFINVAVEAYPNLRANEGFIRLTDELTETENRISVSRRDYNEAITQYNTYIRRFPQVITAKVTGAKQREQFEVAPGAEQAPTVDFQRGRTTGG
jgi:LemA protein